MDATLNKPLLPMSDKYEEEPPVYESARPKRSIKSKVIGLVAITAVASLAFTAYCVNNHVRFQLPGLSSDQVEADKASIEMCSTEGPLKPVTAPKKNIWKNFNKDEVVTIRNWLRKPEQGLNITKSRGADEGDNVIDLIEAYPPSKAEALAYFAGEGPAPEKYARAVISHGNEQVIRDWLIGPLPLSSKTTLRPLTEIYHNWDAIPFNARAPFTPRDLKSLGAFVQRVMSPLSEVTLDLFGAQANGYKNDTLIFAGNAPASYDGTWRRYWMPLKLNVPGSFLHPVDFYIYVDVTGIDQSKWKVLKLVYNHQVFDTVDELAAAWKSGSLVRSEPPENKSDWASRVRRGTGRDLDDRAGPRSVMFDGYRFRADLDQQYITWMGWSFYLGFEAAMGLNLRNIMFRGERIFYEIVPQEAMAQYSGNDPHQASTVWLDSNFMMGQNVRELFVGYDCPADALYLPMDVHAYFGTTSRVNAICVFERDSGKPISRHTGWLKNEMGAVKGYELVVRSISTVGNYDYLFDYTFMLDGSVELRVSASGYLQAGVFDEQQTSYGHRIRDTTMGSLHDHVINYKVDFDVAGVKNSLMAVTLEMEDRDEPWFAEDDWGGAVTQQKIVRRFVETEDNSKFNFPVNGQGTFVITNEAEKNSWGVSRGYAIHPGQSAIHLTNLDSKRTEKNVDWAKQSLSFTRRSEREPSSSSLWNMNLPGKPPVDFSKFFDGESLDQEDIVAWINLGTHHIPTSSDVPHTLTNLATSSVLITPFNYNDYDVSMEVMNSMLLNTPENAGKDQFEITGHITPSYCLPQRPKAFSYTGMISYEEDGSLSPAGSAHSQRMQAEMIHGLRAIRPGTEL